MRIKSECLRLYLTISLFLFESVKALPQNYHNRKYMESFPRTSQTSNLTNISKPLKHHSEEKLQIKKDSPQFYLNDVEYDLRLRQLMEELVFKSHFDDPQEVKPQQNLRSTLAEEANYKNRRQPVSYSHSLSSSINSDTTSYEIQQHSFTKDSHEHVTKDKQNYIKPTNGKKKLQEKVQWNDMEVKVQILGNTENATTQKQVFHQHKSNSTQYSSTPQPSFGESAQEKYSNTGNGFFPHQHLRETHDKKPNIHNIFKGDTSETNSSIKSSNTLIKPNSESIRGAIISTAEAMPENIEVEYYQRDKNNCTISIQANEIKQMDNVTNYLPYGESTMATLVKDTTLESFLLPVTQDIKHSYTLLVLETATADPLEASGYSNTTSLANYRNSEETFSMSGLNEIVEIFTTESPFDTVHTNIPYDNTITHLSERFEIEDNDEDVLTRDSNSKSNGDDTELDSSEYYLDTSTEAFVGYESEPVDNASKSETSTSTTPSTIHESGFKDVTVQNFYSNMKESNSPNENQDTLFTKNIVRLKELINFRQSETFPPIKDKSHPLIPQITTSEVTNSMYNNLETISNDTSSKRPDYNGNQSTRNQIEKYTTEQQPTEGYSMIQTSETTTFITMSATESSKYTSLSEPVENDFTSPTADQNRFIAEPEKVDNFIFFETGSVPSTETTSSPTTIDVASESVTQIPNTSIAYKNNFLLEFSGLSSAANSNSKYWNISSNAEKSYIDFENETGNAGSSLITKIETNLISNKNKESAEIYNRKVEIRSNTDTITPMKNRTADPEENMNMTLSSPSKTEILDTIAGNETSKVSTASDLYSPNIVKEKLEYVTDNLMAEKVELIKSILLKIAIQILKGNNNTNIKVKNESKIRDEYKFLYSMENKSSQLAFRDGYPEEKYDEIAPKDKNEFPDTFNNFSNINETIVLDDNPENEYSKENYSKISHATEDKEATFNHFDSLESIDVSGNIPPIVLQGDIGNYNLPIKDAERVPNADQIKDNQEHEYLEKNYEEFLDASEDKADIVATFSIFDKTRMSNTSVMHASLENGYPEENYSKISNATEDDVTNVGIFSNNFEYVDAFGNILPAVLQEYLKSMENAARLSNADEHTEQKHAKVEEVGDKDTTLPAFNNFDNMAKTSIIYEYVAPEGEHLEEKYSKISDANEHKDTTVATFNNFEPADAFGNILQEYAKNMVNPTRVTNNQDGEYAEGEYAKIVPTLHNYDNISEKSVTYDAPEDEYPEEKYSRISNGAEDNKNDTEANFNGFVNFKSIQTSEIISSGILQGYSEFTNTDQIKDVNISKTITVYDSPEDEYPEEKHIRISNATENKGATGSIDPIKGVNISKTIIVYDNLEDQYTDILKPEEKDGSVDNFKSYEYSDEPHIFESKKSDLISNSSSTDDSLLKNDKQHFQPLLENINSLYPDVGKNASADKSPTLEFKKLSQPISNRPSDYNVEFNGTSGDTNSAKIVNFFQPENIVTRSANYIPMVTPLTHMLLIDKNNLVRKDHHGNLLQNKAINSFEEEKDKYFAILKGYNNLETPGVFQSDFRTSSEKAFGNMPANFSENHGKNLTTAMHENKLSNIQNLTDKNQPPPDDNIETATKVILLTQHNSYQKPSIFIENTPPKEPVSSPLYPVPNAPIKIAKVNISKQQNNSNHLSGLISIVGNALQELATKNEHPKEREQANKFSAKQKLKEEVTVTVNCHIGTISYSIALPPSSASIMPIITRVDEEEGKIEQNVNDYWNGRIEKPIENGKQNIRK